MQACNHIATGVGVKRALRSSQVLAVALVWGCGAASVPHVSEQKPQAPAEPTTDNKLNLIRVQQPRPDAVVHSPLLVTGEARGTWYFEASFPVSLLDANGNKLVQTHAQAQGEWMTEGFVPFKSELSFPLPSTATGTLVLEKDNPSGLPEHADELRLPVRFAPTEP